MIWKSKQNLATIFPFNRRVIPKGIESVLKYRQKSHAYSSELWFLRM